MCLIESKKLPPIDISLLKMYIKDLTKDINTIQNHIDMTTNTKNHLNRDLEIFLNEKMYALAKDKQKHIKKVYRRLENLEIAKQTLEIIRLKYGVACQQLRDLYVRKNYFEQKQKDNSNVVSFSILEEKLNETMNKIQSIRKEFNLF